jgi:hypothetical protein
MLASDISFEDMYNKIKLNKPLNKAEKALARKYILMLETYSKALTIGSELSRISSFLKPLREMPVMKEDIDKALRIRDRLFTRIGEDTYTTNSSIMNFDGLITKLPHLKAAYDILDEQHRLEQKHFFMYSKKITDGLKEIENRSDVEFASAEDKAIAFSKFLYGQIDFDPEYEGFGKEPPYRSRGATYVGERAFKERFIDSVLKMKKDKRFDDNDFIQSLKIDYNYHGQRAIKFPIGKNMDYEDIIDFQKAFEELINYEIEDGKIVDSNIEFKPKELTLGYSKLQKDFLRYLVAETGMRFFPDSYIKVIPVEMKVIYQRAFENLLYNREHGIIANDASFNSVMDLFEVESVVKEGISTGEIRRKRDAIRRNPDAEEEFPDYSYEEVVGDGLTVHGDMAIKIVKNEETGNIDRKFLRTKAKEYVYTKFRERGSSRVKVTVFKRVAITPNAVVYVKLGVVDPNAEIKQHGNKVLGYDMSSSFNPFYQHVKVKNVGSKEVSSFKKIKTGTIISISGFDDPARVDVKFVKIVKVRKKELDNGNTQYIYTVEDYNGDLISSDTNVSGESLRDDSIVEKMAAKEAPSTTHELLTLIEKEVPEYANIAKMLKRFKTTKYTVPTVEELDPRVAAIYMTSTETGSERVNVKFDVRGRVAINLNTITNLKNTASSLLHEEIHRYSVFLLRAYELGLEAVRKGEVKSVKEYMKKNNFTDDEILFVRRVRDLHHTYMQKSDATGAIKSAMTDVIEFITYGLTDPKVIEELKNMEADITNEAGNTKSIFRALIDIIADLFKTDAPTVYALLEESFNQLTLKQKNLDRLAGSMYYATSAEFVRDYVKKYMGGGVGSADRIDPLFSLIDPDRASLGISKETGRKVYDAAILMQQVYENYPEYRDISSVLVEMERSLMSRVYDADLPEDEGLAVIGADQGKFAATVGLDMAYFNSLSDDPEVRSKQLASTLIHEALHRYTSHLLSYSQYIELDEYEKEFIKKIRRLYAMTKEALKDFKSVKDPYAEDLLFYISDVHELVAHGLTDRIAVMYLKEIASPFDPTRSVYEDLKTTVLDLFKESRTDANSVYNNLIESPKLAKERFGKPTTEEDLQQSLVMCGG